VRRTAERALALPADLTKETEIVELFRKSVQTYGRLDVLVNNAGIATHKNTEDISIDYWNDALAINITVTSERVMPRGLGSISSITLPEGGGGELRVGNSRQAIADWEQHGVGAIKTVRMRDPSTYLRVCASLLPREMTVDAMVTTGMTADERIEMIAALKQQLFSVEHAPPKKKAKIIHELNGNGAAPRSRQDQGTDCAS